MINYLIFYIALASEKSEEKISNINKDGIGRFGKLKDDIENKK